MPLDIRRIVYWVVLCAVAAAGAWVAYGLTSTPRPPTLAEYLATIGKQASLAGPRYVIAGRPADCGGRPIVLHPGLDDVAAAHPGFLIINPTRLEKLPAVVQLYAFGHECGHQVVGPDEAKADCHAVSTGKSAGWLDAKGVEAICAFWEPHAGDDAHLPGKRRCALMRQCFADAGAG